MAKVARGSKPDQKPRPDGSSMRAALLVLGGLFGFTGVMAAAASAHGPLASTSAMTAAILQMIHAVLLVALALGPAFLMQARLAVLAAGTLAAGVLMFCGAIYLGSWFGLQLPLPLAPIGGGALMLGWLLLAAVGGQALRPK